MKEWLLTFRLRRYKGHLTLWEFYIWRMYRRYVVPRLQQNPTNNPPKILKPEDL